MDGPAEQALRDALAFAESVIDTMRDPLLVLDADRRKGLLRITTADGRKDYRLLGEVDGHVLP